MQTYDETFPGRRRFLKQAAAIGGTGMLAVLAGDAGAGGQDGAAVADGAAARVRRGYRLTAHIRAYYDTARS